MKIKLEFELDHNETNSFALTVARMLQSNITEALDIIRNRTDAPFPFGAMMDEEEEELRTCYVIQASNEEGATKYVHHKEGLTRFVNLALKFDEHEQAQAWLDEYQKVRLEPYMDNHVFSITQKIL